MLLFIPVSHQSSFNFFESHNPHWQYFLLALYSRLLFQADYFHILGLVNPWTKGGGRGNRAHGVTLSGGAPLNRGTIEISRSEIFTKAKKAESGLPIFKHWFRGWPICGLHLKTKLLSNFGTTHSDEETRFCDPSPNSRARGIEFPSSLDRVVLLLECQLLPLIYLSLQEHFPSLLLKRDHWWHECRSRSAIPYLRRKG